MYIYTHNTYTHIYTHTHTYTHIHIYTHTYIHTYIREKKIKKCTVSTTDSRTTRPKICGNRATKGKLPTQKSVEILAIHV